VFCESTRDALRFHADNDAQSSWSGTADVLSLILKLWNALNVKTSSKGKRMRDYTMDPVRSSMDWRLDFLREFAVSGGLENFNKTRLKQRNVLGVAAHVRGSC